MNLNEVLQTSPLSTVEKKIIAIIFIDNGSIANCQIVANWQSLLMVFSVRLFAVGTWNLKETSETKNVDNVRERSQMTSSS